MSTQHPDNAFMPSFATNGEVIKGEDEIAEAQYVFSTLGCDEQMWDYEGKGADVDVVMKLLIANPQYFQEHLLGRDVFLTLRIPNPSVEVGMRKKVQEALHNIATSYDLAQQFYQQKMEAPPIFEVILPLTHSAEELLWVYRYYQELVAGCEEHKLVGDKPLKEWLGETFPKRINVIPLVEDLSTLSHIDDLVGRYLDYMEMTSQQPSHMRVFLARSDPALNYGMVTATLLNKIALQRLEGLERARGLPIYPIIGVGGVPFRGNFRPGFVDSVLREYPSVQTFTVQSSFKYDHDQASVQQAVRRLLEWQRGRAVPIDEEQALLVMKKYTACYQSTVERLAPLINAMAPLIPQRRARRLHIGLYGYSRTIEETGGTTPRVQLPRAITFCAALYSLGVPPELIGLESLSKEDWAFLREVYPHLLDDLAAAGQYANEEAFRHLVGDEAWGAASRYIFEVDREHRSLTSMINDRLEAGYDRDRTRQLAIWAAETRGFLG